MAVSMIKLTRIVAIGMFFNILLRRFFIVVFVEVEVYK